jgi:flagellar M-ring protein FliF
VRRLTAAVVVNHRGGRDGAAPAPLSEQEMANVNALVREAMGFSKERGDSINVVNAAFSTTELAAAEPLPVWKQPDAIALGKEVGKALLFLLLTLILVFGVLRPAIKTIGAPVKVALPALPPAAPPPPQLPAEETRALTAIDQVREIAKTDPATVANVVKAWVGEQK